MQKRLGQQQGEIKLALQFPAQESNGNSIWESPVLSPVLSVCLGMNLRASSAGSEELHWNWYHVLGGGKEYVGQNLHRIFHCSSWTPLNSLRVYTQICIWLQCSPMLVVYNRVQILSTLSCILKSSTIPSLSLTWCKNNWCRNMPKDTVQLSSRPEC